MCHSNISILINVHVSDDSQITFLFLFSKEKVVKHVCLVLCVCSLTTHAQITLQSIKQLDDSDYNPLSSARNHLRLIT